MELRRRAAPTTSSQLIRESHGLPIDPGASGSSNLALGKTASASSVENGHISPRAGLRRKRHDPMVFNVCGFELISVDLGAPKALGRVVLRWETAYGKAYQMQVSSDNQTWSTVFTRTMGRGEPRPLPSRRRRRGMSGC